LTFPKPKLCLDKTPNQGELRRRCSAGTKQRKRRSKFKPFLPLIIIGMEYLQLEYQEGNTSALIRADRDCRWKRRRDYSAG